MKLAKDPRLALLEFVQIPFWIFDVENLRLVWANPEGLKFWNAESIDDITNRDFSEDISCTVKSHLTQVKNDCLETGHSKTENWTLYPDGKPHNGEAVLSPFVLENGTSMLLIHIILERKDETSDTLRSAQALMHTPTMISLYDEDYELLYANPAARAISNNSTERLDNKICHGQDLQDINMMLNLIGTCEKEVLINTQNGPVWHSASFQRSMDPVTGKYAILCSSIDISDRKKAQQEAYTLAYTDSLTNLPNRMALLEHVNRLCVKKKEKFGLLFLDLDRFKVINDSLGHLIGDNLLKEVGNRLKTFMRHRPGIISRLGGDEFVLILEDTTDRPTLHAIATMVLNVLDDDMLIDGYNISVVPSVGICMYPDDGDNTTTLMQHADVAMYSAKASKSGYCFFEPSMNKQAEKRLELEHDLVNAIKNDQFELYYQPKISSSNYAITGMEALIRWFHPEKGMISPAEFIPIAEETGLINKIGSWVMREAMEQQRAWESDGNEIVVAVNISPIQFTSQDLLNQINAAEAATSCNPSLIEFEITESLLLGDSSKITELLKQLSGKGYRIALDDFGTGYSNLAYLSNYPLTCLKIDQRFVMDIKQTAILEMVIKMGKMLGLKLVAEGVETIEQIAWLKAAGCDELQGYYFSKPITAADATKFIRSYDFPVDAYEEMFGTKLDKVA